MEGWIKNELGKQSNIRVGLDNVKKKNSAWFIDIMFPVLNQWQFKVPTGMIQAGHIN